MLTFRLQVMSLRRMLFDGDVKSVYLSGDEGEYELLPFHYPLLGALPEGEIKIAEKGSVPLRAGVVMFQNNRCTIIIEENEEASSRASQEGQNKGT